MPQRIQKTPYGDVSLTSRWMRDHYVLVAYGSELAVHWLFPNKRDVSFERANDKVRHAFVPAPSPITVERELRRACSKWQDHWNERLVDHQAGIHAVPPLTNTPAITTLGQLFDHLYEERKTSVARSTTSRDRYRLQLWRDTLGDTCPLASVTHERITSALFTIGKRVSPATANPALGVLKTYLNWAAQQELLHDLSYKHVQPLKERACERHHRAWWTADDVARAITVASHDHHQPTAVLLVALGCYLGLRVEEIIMLRWQDLSLDATNPKTGEPCPVCHVTPHDDWQPKDGEARDIPICSELLAILKHYQRSEGYLLQAEEGRPGRPRRSTGWSYRYDPKKTWARISKQIVAHGGRAITMYGMRHSFASNLLIAGISDVKVSRWLGHADTQMVHRHYGHLLSYDHDINAIGRPRG